MTNLNQQFAALEPVQSFEDLSLDTKRIVWDLFPCSGRNTYEMNADELYLNLKKIYVHTCDVMRDEQYAALHFLWCLKRSINERAKKRFYKRDERGFWSTCSYDTLAYKYADTEWRELATWCTVWASKEPGDTLESALDLIEESFMNALDAAGVFVTSQKPDDFEE